MILFLNFSFIVVSNLLNSELILLNVDGYSIISHFYFAAFYRHPSPSVLIPALRTVGNIVTGDDTQTQVLDIPYFHQQRTV